jgi:DNA binding domain, excisionase family
MEITKSVLNIEEAAEYLGLSRTSMYKLAKSKGFPAVILGERRIVVPIDKLNEWLNNQCEV